MPVTARKRNKLFLTWLSWLFCDTKNSIFLESEITKLGWYKRLVDKYYLYDYQNWVLELSAVWVVDSTEAIYYENEIWVLSLFFDIELKFLKYFVGSTFKLIMSPSDIKFYLWTDEISYTVSHLFK